jgi:quinoprotein glucose dehydrogenase
MRLALTAVLPLICAIATAAPTRSVRDGVYSAEQAWRGKVAYESKCARCHGDALLGGENSPPLVDHDFLDKWNGQTVGRLVELTRKTMPFDGPGTLSLQQCTDITAYLLSVNGFATGKDDLVPDPEVLRQISIQPKLRDFAASNPPSVPHAIPATTQQGEWRYYGGDAGSTKYSPLDQIDVTNVKQLQIAWRWKAENFGPRPDYNWEVTPLMIGGVLYFTAGSRRDAIAVDAATGETLWMYRLNEGERGDRAVRTQNRGLAYWSDGRNDRRILLVSPGFQLVALDAQTGVPIPSFGRNGIVELTEGLDRDVVKPGQIGSSSPAIVIRDVVVVGAALAAGSAPASKSNVPGYIRGYDVRTGKRIWTFRTIPHPGEPGNETWLNDSWQYTGNTGAWAPLSGDEELGYVYIPVEMPTGDFYGAARLGDNLYADSLLCLDARTGKRVWHFQTVHHDLWDWDLSSAPILADITVDGKRIKAVAQVTKQAFTFVFDRVTGKPVWPIEERPVPQSSVPGEKTSPTQPFPTKPAPFDRQGITADDLIDFTPELKAEALKIVAQYQTGPLYLPPRVRDAGGKLGALILPHHTGGANWPGGAFDPETGILYVSSLTNPDALALSVADPKRSDMGYIASMRSRGEAERPADPAGGRPRFSVLGEGSIRPNIGPQGLPLVKPPWGRITAIDLNTGEHVWMIANGDAPEAVKSNPALKGLDLSNVLKNAGKPERSPLLVTRTLLFGADGSGLFNAGPDAGGRIFRAIDKKTGAIIHEMALPASTTGVPMTYMVDGKQYIVVATGARGVAAELVALALP